MHRPGLVRPGVGGGRSDSAEDEDENEAQDGECLGDSEAQDGQRLEDALGLRLTGHTVDEGSEDEADREGRAQRRDAVANEGKGAGHDLQIPSLVVSYLGWCRSIVRVNGWSMKL